MVTQEMLDTLLDRIHEISTAMAKSNIDAISYTILNRKLEKLETKYLWALAEFQVQVLRYQNEEIE